MSLPLSRNFYQHLPEGFFMETVDGSFVIVIAGWIESGSSPKSTHTGNFDILRNDGKVFYDQRIYADSWKPCFLPPKLNLINLSLTL